MFHFSVKIIQVNGDSFITVQEFQNRYYKLNKSTIALSFQCI
jgi:hypothetical protein